MGKEKKKEEGEGEEEEEVQVIMPPLTIQIQSPSLQITHQTPPAIANIPKSSSSQLYDKFTSRKSQEAAKTLLRKQLNRNNHPFFLDFLDISEELKVFLHKLLPWRMTYLRIIL